MKIFDTFYSYLESKNRNFFYFSFAGFLGAMICFIGIFVYQYYSHINFLNKRIQVISELQDDTRIILEKALQVKNQRNEVDSMLAEDLDFKIGGYFSTILSELNLLNKKAMDNITQIDREDNYRESELTAELFEITMKNLTDLLFQIEQKKRIYIKKLEIEKSKKLNHSIDVLITIATLLQKTE